jgi:SAM-dependent methyltransferase
MSPALPQPTGRHHAVARELDRWRRVYAGPDYFYGREPGPVARRAVRYHRVFLPQGGRALDGGCGEGQDLLFLAERGYAVTGVELTPEGAAKARALLAEHELPGTVAEGDLTAFLEPSRGNVPVDGYDLVLAVNAVQFLGEAAPRTLELLQQAVAPGGVLGFSLFALEGDPPPSAPARGVAVQGTLCFFSLGELLARFRAWHKLEAALLWQWNTATDEPQAFVTLIARKPTGWRHDR